MVFLSRFVGKLTLEPGEQDFVDRIELEAGCHQDINFNRIARGVADETSPVG